MSGDQLPTMRVTDPNGIGLDTTALDIDLSDGRGTIRVWLSSEGLRVEAQTGNRLRVAVKDSKSLVLSVED